MSVVFPKTLTIVELDGFGGARFVAERDGALALRYATLAKGMIIFPSISLYAYLYTLMRGFPLFGLTSISPAVEKTSWMKFSLTLNGFFPADKEMSRYLCGSPWTNTFVLLSTMPGAAPPLSLAGGPLAPPKLPRDASP